MNPYLKLTGEIRGIMADLIRKMTDETDLKVFRNIAAVYVVWQHELQEVERELMEYDMKRLKRKDDKPCGGVAQ